MYVPISPLEQRREQAQVKSVRGLAAPSPNNWALREEDEDEHVRRNGTRVTSALGGSVVGGRLGLGGGLAPRIPRRSMSYSAHSHREAVELSIQDAAPRRASPAHLKPAKLPLPQPSKPSPAARQDKHRLSTSPASPYMSDAHGASSCDGVRYEGNADSPRSGYNPSSRVAAGQDAASGDAHLELAVASSPRRLAPPLLALVATNESEALLTPSMATEPEPESKSESGPGAAAPQVGQMPALYLPSLKIPDSSDSASAHWRHELELVANNLVEWLDAMESEIVALEQAQI
ncbi:hypothetical protein GGI00_001750 [Coemansia sp. RSA 2681]|nr:hypothetical protein GGI00_001750 [Coemansia sp. RSA 2681]